MIRMVRIVHEDCLLKRRLAAMTAALQPILQQGAAHMPIPAVSSPPAPAASAISTTARTADGDYLAKSSKTTGTKDADGDYKPVATQAATSPAATTSNSAQAALTNIKLGG